MLQEAEQAIRSVSYDRVTGAVVGVGRRGPRGSGLVIAAGKVLTNAHNLWNDQVRVTFGDGQSEVGEALGRDIDADLAVVAVDTGDIAPLPWAERVDVATGSAVLAVANPGGRGLRVTLGFVSGTDRTFRGPSGRRIAGALEHTAALLPGSSGGPLVDLEGRVIGINTHRLGEGFYLAVPAGSTLRTRVDALVGGQEPSRFRLGIAVVPSSIGRGMRRAVGLADIAGVLVRHLESESPAAAAGLEAGDLIAAIGGRSIGEVDDLFAALDAVAPGDSLEILILRGADEMTLSVDVPAEGDQVGN